MEKMNKFILLTIPILVTAMLATMAPVSAQAEQDVRWGGSWYGNFWPGFSYHSSYWPGSYWGGWPGFSYYNRFIRLGGWGPYWW